MRVRDFKRFEARVGESGEGGCWLWAGALNRWGYGRFMIGGREEMAHRAAWMLYKGEIPDGKLVLHRCDVPACVNPAHLFLGTHADNTADMMKKGRCKTLRLTDEQVREIRALRAAGVLIRVVAEQVGASETTVSDIEHGRRRASVR